MVIGGIACLSLFEASKRVFDVSASNKLRSMMGSSQCFQNLTLFSQKLRQTAKISKLLTKSIKNKTFRSSEECSMEIEEIINYILAALSDLSVQDFIIVPGGWSKHSGGHAILFVIQREIDFVGDG